MPRIPGTQNGGIPANIVWNPDNPPLKCDGCGLVTIHAPDCDGKFTKTPLVESEVELLNEHREWARLGMNTAMVTRDLFKMGNQIQALVNVINELTGDEGILNEEYRNCTINEMRRIRLANEEEVKRANLGLPPRSILGPDGSPL